MTESRERARNRLLAFAGLWLLLSGLLLALSLVDLVLVANGIVLFVALAAGTIWLLRRLELGWRLAAGLVPAAAGARRLGTNVHELHLGRRLVRAGIGPARAFGRATMWLLAVTTRGGRRLWRRMRAVEARRHARRVAGAARGAAAGTAGRADRLLRGAIRAYAIAVYRFQLWTARTLQHPGFVAVQRQALRLQLTLARRLGNEQAEALTLNELALALAERGAEAEAVEHLEEALVVLREIGDQEHEAQVIANLGMVYRRQGQSEEAAHLFQEALEKLSPESPAYREVEKELLRAS
jgi:tetratricopeptide (TPR) repeat protein